MNEEAVKELWQLIDDYSSSRVDMSWAGGGPPEDMAEIERELKEAENALAVFIKQHSEV